MERKELEALLLKKDPAGPFVSDGRFGVVLGNIVSGHIVSGHIYDWPQGTQVEQLNRAYQIGRWMGRTEEQPRWVGRTEEQPPSPPIAPDDLYQPICTFCGRKVDEMVTVHFKSGDRRMCIECMNKGPNWK